MQMSTHIIFEFKLWSKYMELSRAIGDFDAGRSRKTQYNEKSSFSKVVLSFLSMMNEAGLISYVNSNGKHKTILQY